MTTTYVPLKYAKKAMREVREESLREGERRGYARATEFVRMASSLNGSTHAVLKALQEEGDGLATPRNRMVPVDGDGAVVDGAPDGDLDAVLMAALDALTEAKTHHPETDGGPVYAYLAGLLSDPEALADAIREMDGGETITKAVTHAPKGGVSIGGKDFTGGEFIPAEVMENATEEEKTAVQGNTSGDSSPKKKPTKSQAEVKYASSKPSRQSEIDEVLKSTLGTDDAEEVASSVGAPDDAIVKVDWAWNHDYTAKRSKVTIEHPDFTAVRYIGKTKDGTRTYIRNDEFWVKEDAQGKGIGADVFARQVENAAELGVAYIHCHAAQVNGDGEPVHNGYYTWPRFGYDQSLTDSAGIAEEDKPTFEAARERFPEAKTVLDIMESPEGREWWKKNGTDLLNAKFDLSEGSRSMRTLERYQLERAAKKSNSMQAKSLRWTLRGISSEQIHKSFDPSKHPRDDAGRFVSKEAIHAAKSDPKKAEELRARVTNPEQRKKLDAALDGPVDLGRTKAGAHREQVAKRKQDRAERVKRAQELANEISMWRRGGEAVPSSHFRELAEVLPSMTVAELRSVRGKLAASFGGERRKSEMAARLLEHAKNKAALLETNERNEDMDALDFGSLHEYQNEGNAKGNEARNPNPEEQHGGRMQQRHDLMGAGAKGELNAPGKLSHGTPDTGSVLKLGDKLLPPQEPLSEPSEPTPSPEPPAKKLTEKKTRKPSATDSLYDWTRHYGSIDPQSHAFQTFFSSVNEARENGIPLGVFKNGGEGLDVIARQMLNSGHINAADEVEAQQVLLDGLASHAYSYHADRTKDYDKALQNYERAKQEAADALDESSIREAERSGEAEADRGEPASGRGEDQGHDAGDGGRQPGDAAEPTGQVDTSFDFGELAPTSQAAPSAQPNQKIAETALDAKKQGATRSRSAVEFDEPITGSTGAKLHSYDWKHRLEEDERDPDKLIKVSDWDEAHRNEHTGRDVVHHFHVTTPDGTRHTVSLETALNLMYGGKADPGVAKVKNLAQASMQLAEYEHNHAKMTADSSVPGWKKKQSEDRLGQMKERVKNLTDEAKLASSGSKPIDVYREKAHKIESLRNLFFRHPAHKGQYQNVQIEEIAKAAAPNDPNKRREIYEQGRKVLNGLARVGRMNVMGERTPNTPIANEHALDYRGQPLTPWSDAKMRNWYFSHGKDADTAINDAHEWLKANHPVYGEHVENPHHSILSGSPAASDTPLSPAAADAVKSAVKHHKRMQMPGKPVPQMVVYHIPEHRNTGGQLIEPAKVNAVPVNSYTGEQLLSGKLPHLKIEGTFEVGADGVPKRVEPTQTKAIPSDWDDLRAELAVRRGIVHDDGATGV